MKLAPGRRFGRWSLLDKLGGGGNADVWSAADEHGNHAAIKILRQRRVDSEPHERFRREVATLAELTEQRFRGILPILDSHIPDGDTREHAWLVTPVATPIRTALGDTPALSDVVAAIAAIADTLECLTERRLAHRDVKPENLFHFNGQWVIGDFGLVTTQESALTAKAAMLGPKFYIAPEMLNDPGSAVGPPADVYSLAKSLWVLATGQRFPVPGQHQRDYPGATVSAYVSHPRAKTLDLALEEATSLDPARRPSAGLMRDTLEEWCRQEHAQSWKDEHTTIRQQLTDALGGVDHVLAREDRITSDLNVIHTRLQHYLDTAAEAVESYGLPRPTVDHLPAPVKWSQSSDLETLETLLCPAGMPERSLLSSSFYAGTVIPIRRRQVGRGVFVEAGFSVHNTSGKGAEATCEFGMGLVLLGGHQSYVRSTVVFPRDFTLTKAVPILIRRTSGTIGTSQIALACDQLGQTFLATLPQALYALSADIDEVRKSEYGDVPP